MIQRQRRLESLSAEFALLAQRRARLSQRIDLLDQQRDAAALSIARLQARMGWLAQRMDAADPSLRDQPPDNRVAPARLASRPAMQPRNALRSWRT
jgi:uncharacterized coiled-coil protein SlyX